MDLLHCAMTKGKQLKKERSLLSRECRSTKLFQNFKTNFSSSLAMLIGLKNNRAFHTPSTLKVFKVILSILNLERLPQTSI